MNYEYLKYGQKISSMIGDELCKCGRVANPPYKTCCQACSQNNGHTQQCNNRNQHQVLNPIWTVTVGNSTGGQSILLDNLNFSFNNYNRPPNAPHFHYWKAPTSGLPSNILPGQILYAGPVYIIGNAIMRYLFYDQGLTNSVTREDGKHAHITVYYCADAQIQFNNKTYHQ
jgi:hypothetical protein